MLKLMVLVCYIKHTQEVKFVCQKVKFVCQKVKFV